MAKNWWRKKEKVSCHCHHASGGVYGLGFIGAAVFYIQQATTFWEGFFGLFKAIVWPAFLVYKLFG